MLGMAAQFAGPLVEQAAKNPAALTKLGARGAGRLMGLSGADLDALDQKGGPVSGMPGWLWAVLGLAAGATIAVWACEKHPEYVPNFMPGKRP